MGQEKTFLPCPSPKTSGLCRHLRSVVHPLLCCLSQPDRLILTPFHPCSGFLSPVSHTKGSSWVQDAG